MTQVENENVRYHYQQLFLGAGLAIGGNLLISISLNLQKFTHVRNSQRAETRHYTREALWWLGLALMVLGEVGNFTAYGFAPASLVAPLGTTTVVANMFLAACFLREKIRPENLFGCALSIIGAFLLVTFSSKNERVLNGDEITAALTQIGFLVYVGVEMVALGILFFLLYKLQMKKVVIFLLITSIIASFTVITAKGVSSMIQLTFAGYPQFRYAVLYVMLVIMVATAIIQIKYLNLAMKEFESSVVVPTNFVFFTISAIVAGIIFYRELWGMTALEICMFVFGCVLSFIGVYFITVSRPPLPEVKPNPAQSQLASDLFPSWLLANVHVGTVQPQGEVSHLSDTDRDKVPMLTAEQLPASISDDSLDRVAHNGEAQGLPNYGATILESPTHGEAKKEE